MERVQVLIDKLIQQKQQNESAAQLLFTVQLLQQELLQLQQGSADRGSKKVAVIMPTQTQVRNVYEEMPREEIKPQPAVVAKEAAPPPPPPVTENYTLKRPSITLVMEEKGEQKEEPKHVPPPAPAPAAAPSQHYLFDVADEVPTLLQHTPQEEKKIHKEINQLIHGQQLSLNDQLKQPVTEVAHVLQDSPIKDLRKAIGINDKFLFLNELFNGDEVMYERSIKTINNFHILQEAEYWMNRELKVRLGWNDSKETVQHFYQLVRRRFS